MKILFTEAQIFGLLKEQYNETKYGDYVNRLLDKINATGILSLSDEERSDLDRLSQGEDIVPDEETKEPEAQSGYSDGYEDEDEDEDLMDIPPTGEEHEMFMGLIPQHTSVDVDGVEWIIEKKKLRHGLKVLNVSNQGVEINVGAFIDGDKFLIKGPEKEETRQVNVVPKTEDEMETFINNFFKNDLKLIVKNMTKKQ